MSRPVIIADRSTVWRAIREQRAFFCPALGSNVQPRLVREDEGTCRYFHVQKVRCPHCGHYHDVKVSVS